MKTDYRLSPNKILKFLGFLIFILFVFSKALALTVCKSVSLANSSTDLWLEMYVNHPIAIFDDVPVCNTTFSGYGVASTIASVTGDRYTSTVPAAIIFSDVETQIRTSACLKASTQELVGSCQECNIENEDAAVDGSNTTASTLSIPATMEDGYFGQKLIFNNTGKKGDSIKVNLGIPEGTLNIEALANITLGTYNGAENNNDGIAINSQLLKIEISGNRFTASFIATADFDRIAVQFNRGGKDLATKLNIYGVAYRYAKPTVTGADTAICAGQSVTLTAEVEDEESVRWYDKPIGGTELGNEKSYITPPLLTTATYYLELTRNGCTDNLRLPVNVNVIAIPKAEDVEIETPIEASCTGGAVLEPKSTTIEGAIFKYYTDQDKTKEIKTGFTGHWGVIYTKDEVTGKLTIEGINSQDAPYKYYISVSNRICESETGTLKEVIVNYPDVTFLDVKKTLEVCGTARLGDAINNYDFSGETIYKFYDSRDNPVTLEAARDIRRSGTYFIQAEGTACHSEKKYVEVIVKPLPELVISQSVFAVNIGDKVILDATTSIGTISWYDDTGKKISNEVGPFKTAGSFAFTVVANEGDCSASGIVFVNVVEQDACPKLSGRVYADSQNTFITTNGDVKQGESAIQDDPKTFSTITSGTDPLGIGRTGQTLTWNTPIAAGTPVTVKLGSEYGGLVLAGAVSVVGIYDEKVIDTLKPVSGGELEDLLSKDNAFEYTFVPSDSTGPKVYNGVRISVQALVGVAQQVKVYYAYYEKKDLQVNCKTNDIVDILYGAVDLERAGSLTTEIEVKDVWNMADGKVDTYTTMYSGLNKLVATEMTIAFNTPTMPGDTLSLVMSSPDKDLEKALLKGFSIQPLLGYIPVGELIRGDLLKISNEGDVTVLKIYGLTEPYNWIKIRLGGDQEVLELLRIHTVNRIANVKGIDFEDEIKVCPGEKIELKEPEDVCTTLKWYDTEIGGEMVAEGLSYTIPKDKPSGEYIYYIQPVRYGCETLSRSELKVIVKATTPKDVIKSISIEGNDDDEKVCLGEEGTVTLKAVLETTEPLTNPEFYWYKKVGASFELVPEAETDILVLKGLVPGEYIYAVGVSSEEYCETVATDRKEIVFTVLPFSKKEDITNLETKVCYGTTAVVEPKSKLEKPVFSWYHGQDKKEQIVDGEANGITYAINAETGALSVTGLEADKVYDYYVAVSSAVSCPNPAGQLAEATITVFKEPSTPTTEEKTQFFCKADNPTVEDLKAKAEVGATVVWYDRKTGGEALPAETSLEDGKTYYASAKIGDCESADPLEVTAKVADPSKPTAKENPQSFCLADNPTVGDLKAKAEGEGSVVWYDKKTGGEVLPAETPLENGKTYYASAKIGDCESAERLEVTVIVENPEVTREPKQFFCKANNPKVENLKAGAKDGKVVWYEEKVGGEALSAETPLENGKIYYASAKIGDCESVERLEVTVTLVDAPEKPVAEKSQSFCLANNPIVGDLKAEAKDGKVVWYEEKVGGEALPAETLLENGKTYYASAKIGDCESVDRLDVTVTLVDAPKVPECISPQSFCLENEPKVSDIEVKDKENVVWYDDVIEGERIPATTPLKQGETIYYVAAVTKEGCESVVRLPVTVKVANPPTPEGEITQDFCIVDDPTIANIQVSGTDVVWYDAVTGGNEVALNTPLVDGATYYAVSEIGDCQSAEPLAVKVTVSACSDLTISKTVDNANPLPEEKVTFTIQVNNIGKGWFENIIMSESLPNGYEFISSEASKGKYNNISGLWNIERLDKGEIATLQIVVKVLTLGNYLNIVNIDSSDPIDSDISNNQAEASVNPQCLLVYNKFSPNGGGANAYFKIECIENYPNNTLTIYNRYGTVVFETRGYKNDWNGTANKEAIIGGNNNQLPSGTYYYILDTGSDQGIKKGWLYIIR